MMNFLEEKSIKIRQKSICHLGLIKECRNARKLKMVNSNSTKVDIQCLKIIHKNLNFSWPVPFDCHVMILKKMLTSSKNDSSICLMRKKNNTLNFDFILLPRFFRGLFGAFTPNSIRSCNIR